MSDTEITSQLAKAIAGHRAAESNEAAAFWQDGIDIHIEAARDAGILKGPDRIDYTLLYR